jgi:outer membrane murein-binding lipoprotein Lpp
MSNRDVYVQKMKSKLDEWNADIDKLAAKVEAAEADTKIAYRTQIENLRAKHAAAGQKLEELRTASEGAWEDMRSGIESAWLAIGSAVKDALSRFK